MRAVCRPWPPKAPFNLLIHCDRHRAERVWWVKSCPEYKDLVESSAAYRNTPFLIIGAGAAALGAASTLIDGGAKPLIVDKGRRPGGRVATQRPSRTSAHWFDTGAQYFTARDTEFRALVEEDVGRGTLTRWQPRVVVATARLETGFEQFTLHDSPDARERFIGPNGLKTWLAERLFELPAEMLPATRVERVWSEANSWRAQTTDGTTVEAARVLITTPPVQAEAMLGQTARAIDALASADRHMAGCQTVVVSAPAHPHFDAAFVHGAKLAWIADNASKYAQATGPTHYWTLHAGVDYSTQYIDAEPSDLAAELLEEFTAITGFERSRIEFVHGHRWRYARPSPSAPEPAEPPYAGLPDNGLALAGDWLAGGRIEGAWRSGVAAARALLDA